MSPHFHTFLLIPHNTRAIKKYQIYETNYYLFIIYRQSFNVNPYFIIPILFNIVSLVNSTAFVI